MFRGSPQFSIATAAALAKLTPRVYYFPDTDPQGLANSLNAASCCGVISCTIAALSELRSRGLDKPHDYMNQLRVMDGCSKQAIRWHRCYPSFELDSVRSRRHDSRRYKSGVIRYSSGLTSEPSLVQITPADRMSPSLSEGDMASSCMSLCQLDASPGSVMPWRHSIFRLGKDLHVPTHPRH